MTYQNLWNIARAIYGKCIFLNACIRKEEWLMINYLSVLLRSQQESSKVKVTDRENNKVKLRKIIKIKIIYNREESESQTVFLWRLIIFVSPHQTFQQSKDRTTIEE